jgi:O-antigen ligase
VNGWDRPLARAFGVALLAGVLVAFTPRYWRVTVPVVCVSLVALLWALTARRVELPRGTTLVAAIGAWGPIQLALHQTRVPWPTTLSSLEWGIGAVSFVLGSQILRESRTRRVFLDLMLWAITALGVAAMLQMYLTPGQMFGIIPVGDSVVGTMYYKNQFAALMEFGAPIALWKVYDGEVTKGGLCYAAMFAAALSSASRMGVILLLVEFLIFLILMVAGRRMPLKSAASMVMILALLITAASFVAGTEQVLSRLEESNPYLLRATLLDSTFRMIPLHPWFGSGMGTWPNEYPGFATFDAGNYVNEAHNDWAQWTSEGGVPFSLLLAALVIWIARPSLRSVWGLGLLGVMVHSYVDYPLRDPALKFIWFGMAGALAPKRSSNGTSQARLY